MASAFGHAAVAIAFGKSLPDKLGSWPVLTAGIFCTIIPDIDVLAFKFGISYEDFWGHRGFTHSLLFAFILGLTMAACFLLKFNGWKNFLLLTFFFTFCCASHILLDAMTNGGLGVAVFSPWDNTRYFLPWNPIAVSPIGATRFFSSRGLDVLSSEAIYIGAPAFFFWLCFFLWNKVGRGR